MANLGERRQPVHIYRVNPPIQDPWRTNADYHDDQRRARKLYWVAVVSMIVAALGVVAAAASAVAAVRSATPQPVKVECVAAPVPASAAPSARPK